MRASKQIKHELNTKICLEPFKTTRSLIVDICHFFLNKHNILEYYLSFLLTVTIALSNKLRIKINDSLFTRTFKR